DHGQPCLRSHWRWSGRACASAASGLTIHSSRHRFAARLNSGVRPQGQTPRLLDSGKHRETFMTPGSGEDWDGPMISRRRAKKAAAKKAAAKKVARKAAAKKAVKKVARKAAAKKAVKKAAKKAAAKKAMKK